MEQGFFTRPLGLWLLTVAVAVALLGLGYELALHNLEPQLLEARTQLAAETSRANRLAADNQRLESRLALAQAENEAQAGRRPAPPPRPEERPAPDGQLEAGSSRLLHRGEAVEAAGGRLVLVLEGFSPDRRQARLLVREPGGQEQGVSLGPGGEVAIRLEGGAYRLMLKKILANSVVYALRPLEENQAPRGRR
ncbi:MAG: hypothetical protein V1806_07185 [Pseudomonadota bacterium]